MAVLKNTYTALQSINPYYIAIEQSDEQQGLIIITDIVNNNLPGEINMQVQGDELWLKVQAEHQVTVLSAPPQNVTAFSPAVTNLNNARIRVKASEVFVLEYNNSLKNDLLHRTAVTGFQLGTFDTVYIKIDTKNDLLTMYHE